MNVDVRYAPDPVRFERLNTAELRENFLVETLFEFGCVKLVYSFIDRAVAGSAVPTDKPLGLGCPKELASEYFAQRREVGVINIGGDGTVTVDGKEYAMGYKDALYIGRESKDIVFASTDPAVPAMFYIVSYPAHATYPTVLARKADATPVNLGSQEKANKRTIFKYIYPAGIKSCQLVMGFTELDPGSVWNTMPAHTHPRRSEVYMYFEVEPEDVVFHYMGAGDQTRHLAVRNRQVALSPSWSIHSGCGTSNYTFVWAMGGENQDFDDMDHIDMKDLA